MVPIARDCTRSSGGEAFQRLAARRAFTLVELVLVLAIMATLAALAIPRYANAIANSRLNSAAQRVAADIALAQATARTTGSRQTITFTLATSRYTLSANTDLAASANPYTVDLTADPYRATLATASFAGSTTLTFDPFGFPLATGSVAVRVGTAQKTVTVAANGRTSIQ